MTSPVGRIQCPTKIRVNTSEIRDAPVWSILSLPLLARIRTYFTLLEALLFVALLGSHVGGRSQQPQPMQIILHPVALNSLTAVADLS